MMVPSFSKSSVFQPTRPRGARRYLSFTSNDFLCFNPRAHEGRDIVIISDIFYSMFQPTRPRGARHSESVSDMI